MTVSDTELAADLPSAILGLVEVQFLEPVVPLGVVESLVVVDVVFPLRHDNTKFPRVEGDSGLCEHVFVVRELFGMPVTCHCQQFHSRRNDPTRHSLPSDLGHLGKRTGPL